MSFQTRNLYHLRVNKHTVIPLYLYLDEKHLDWMSKKILNEIIADLKPLIGPKLVKESHIGASGLSASAMKKAGPSVVEVHRGENYQFAYFLKPSESYDLLTKTRDFVPATAKLDPPTPVERTPTPEPKPHKPKKTKQNKKRTTKTKSRSQAPSTAKKRKRAATDDEEDAEMSDAWSDLDDDLDRNESGEGSGSDVEPTPSGIAPTRRSARQQNIFPDENTEPVHQIELSTGSAAVPDPPVLVKSEPDDGSTLTNLLRIDGTPAPASPSPKPPSDHIIIDEEDEKPKQELHLTYTGYLVPSRCLCIIAEPWAALPTIAQLVSQTTGSTQRKPGPPKSAARAQPLFRPDSDDEESALPGSPEPEFDSDDEEGPLRMFSQMISRTGEKRSGVAARGGMEEFEDDALYGDADEEGRGI